MKAHESSGDIVTANDRSVSSDISVSTVGNRERKPRTSTIQETTVLVLKDLAVESSFFAESELRVIPNIEKENITIGGELGQGEFGIVFEINRIKATEEAKTTPVKPGGDGARSVASSISPFVPPSAILIDADENGIPRESPLAPSQNSKSDDVCSCIDDSFSSEGEEEGMKDKVPGKCEVIDIPLTTDQARRKLAERVYRDGQPRFALKQVKEPFALDAALDLACEARFLQAIKHTNIIRLRATVGTPGTPQFGLVFDRLTTTLQKRLKEWEVVQKKGPKWAIWNKLKRPSEEQEMFFAERLLVALDIARALRHLHKYRLLYRDLKPDNIGFDVRGHIQLFDFGLAKELKNRDFKAYDQYDCTGLTGSRRYMPPEVVRCQPYGLSADVYSFSILFWQVMAIETPFPNHDATKHFEQVVEKRKRPRKLARLPASLQDILEKAWSDTPSERPLMEAWCVQIRDHFSKINERLGGDFDTECDRTHLLTTRSLQSMGVRDS